MFLYQLVRVGVIVFRVVLLCLKKMGLLVKQLVEVDIGEIVIMIVDKLYAEEVICRKRKWWWLG